MHRPIRHAVASALDPASSRRPLHQMFAGITQLGSEHIADAIVYAGRAPVRVNIVDIVVVATQRPSPSG
jgi:NADP-dependent 3-hydroxy acid dehydrogenase YdfG